MDTIVAFKFAGGLDAFPGGCDLDQNAILLDANGLVEGNKFFRLFGQILTQRCHSLRSIVLTLAFVASLSKERRASTSVETRPGMIARISFPNSTS